jgi:Na+-transporting NADH:ubiquinone oxidoreductase subunit A
MITKSRTFDIRRGLELPMAGDPRQTIESSPSVGSVGLVGDDYVGMKPTLEVREGDAVKLGQVLFTDKKRPGVRYTSPVAGVVSAINRGAKRAFQSLVVNVEGDAEQIFTSYQDADLTTLSRDQVRDLLLESGLWTSFRTRPFSMVPEADDVPHSIFVTAIDTNPHAPHPEVVINEDRDMFVYGLQVIRHLTDGSLFLCQAPGVDLPGRDLDSVTVAEFAGPHPAGLPGTHIHFLDPVSEKKTVWHLNYQDVIAVGRLFVSGRLTTERVISIAGPVVKNPRLVRVPLGANLDDVFANEIEGDDVRRISGSVLSGRTAVEPFNFLGRYHLQASALAEGRQRDFLGWQSPGFHKFSMARVYASAWSRVTRKFGFTTSKEGSNRAMVPIGMYERVMPMDILPTFLLRSLIVGDTEQAQQLGCLELDEEDLALCTFVCPGKYEYGPLLRKNLTEIAREG